MAIIANDRLCYCFLVESVFLTYPALFAFLAAILVSIGGLVFFPKARFALFLVTLGLALGFMLTLYFLAATLEELLLSGLFCFALTIIGYLISQKKERRKP